MNTPTVRELERQMCFSIDTFGPGVRLAGVVDHIRKELIEARDEPRDVSEWADIMILAFDGCHRNCFGGAGLYRDILWDYSMYLMSDELDIDNTIDELTEVLEKICMHTDNAYGWLSLYDLARRAAMQYCGVTDEEVTKAYLAKLEKNYARTWPDWRTQPLDKAIEHDRTGSRA